MAIVARATRRHQVPAPAPGRPYVIDFYCPSAKLGFEINGIVHDMGDQPLKDAERDAWLAGQGIAIVRIPASEVLKSDVDIAEAILRRCRG